MCTSLGYARSALRCVRYREHPVTENEEFDHILHQFEGHIAHFEEEDPLSTPHTVC
jgi:hypothetical protein